MAPDQPNIPPPVAPQTPQQPYYAALPPGYGYALPPLTNKLALASMIIGLTSAGVPLLLDLLRYALPYMLGPSYGLPYFFLFSLATTFIGLLAFAGMITAVVLGHIALGRAQRFPWLRPTRGQALTGLIAGYVGLSVQILLPFGVALFYVRFGYWHF